MLLVRKDLLYTDNSSAGAPSPRRHKGRRSAPVILSVAHSEFTVVPTKLRDFFIFSFQPL